MFNFITIVMKNNEKSLIYQIIDLILHINYIYNFIQSFRDLAQLTESKEQKINNNLVIKYSKLVISDIDNL